MLPQHTISRTIALRLPTSALSSVSQLSSTASCIHKQEGGKAKTTKAQTEPEKQKMSCGVLVQKHAAALEHLAMADSRTSFPELQVWADQEHGDTFEAYMVNSGMCGPKLQVWADRENGDAFVAKSEEFKLSDGGVSTFCNKKRTSMKMVKPRRSDEDKENVDPFLLSTRPPTSVPSWLPRYPLQDVTAIIEILQALDMENEARVRSSSRSQMEEARETRNGCSLEVKGSTVKRSRLLQMR